MLAGILALQKPIERQKTGLDTVVTSSLIHNQDCTLRVQRRLKPDSNHLAVMSQYRLPN